MKVNIIRRLIIIIIVLCLAHDEVLGAPSFSTVKVAYQSSDTLLLGQHGEVIYELRVDPNARKLE